MTDVDRLPKRTDPAGELGPRVFDPGRILVQLRGNDQLRPAQLPGLAAGRPRKQVGASRDARAAQDAAPPVHRDLTAVRADCAGRADRREIAAGLRARVADGDRAAEPVGVRVGAAGVSAGHDAVAQPAGYPCHYDATPAIDRPKLASMNGKSVKMSPANTAWNSCRLWNDAERGFTRRNRPSCTSTT